MENNIEYFLKISQDLLDLKNEDAQKISNILSHTNLTNLLNLGHFYKERLLILAGLKKLVTSEDIKERSQLHPIIEKNCWIFGEQYSVTSSDKNLTTVVNKILDEKKYSKITRNNGKGGVLDLLCDVKDNNDNYLLIELKAPNVKIDKDAIDQVEGYKMALEKHLTSTTKTPKITSFVISTELAPYAQNIQRSHPRDGYLYIYTWSEIFDKLEKNFTDMQSNILRSIKNEDGFKYLQQLYSGILGN
jgi:hypothetical protein